MKGAFQIIAVLALLLVLSGTAQAQCPQRANSLEDFRSCMVPLRGTVGTAIASFPGDMDRYHRDLIAAMEASNVVPPQVMPAYSGYTPYYPYNPYMSVSGWYAPSPYFWISYGMRRSW